MTILLFANNAGSTLAGPISAVATTANLAAGTGSQFPNPGAGEYFKLTFIDTATGLLREIVHVTAVAGDVITIVRAQEGTTARAWLASDLAKNLWTAGSAQAMVQSQQIQNQQFTGVNDTGSANSIIIAPSPALSAYAAYQMFEIKAAAANTQSSVTITNGALAPRTLKRADGTALSASEYSAGDILLVIDDGAAYRLLSPAPPQFGVLMNLASAASTDLGTITSHNINVTGTTGITSFGSSASLKNPFYMVTYAGALSLVYNATSMQLLGGASRITNAGDAGLYQYLGGGNWKEISYFPRTSARIRLTANATFYVATTGSDTTGFGTSTAPWATIQKAWDFAKQNLDLNGFSITVNVANGTYTAGLSAFGSLVGSGSALPFTLNFASTSAIVSTTGSDAIFCALGAQVNLVSGKLQTTTSGCGMNCVGFGSRISFSGTEFGACASGHIACGGGEIVVQGSYGVSGSSPSHYYIDGGRVSLFITGGTVTLSGTLNFTYFTNVLNLGAFIKQGSWSYTGGSVTGTKYSVLGNSVINAGGTVFPGSIAGNTGTGGQIF